MTYKVKLEVFEGPLDLLLTLIERQELDITVVSLAEVTSQYLDYIRRLEAVHPEALADFLVVAAKLIYIKSVALLPRPETVGEDGEEEDLGDDLVRQLEEYRKFKRIAHALAGRQESGLRAHVRIAPPPQIESTTFRLEGVVLDDLLRAAREAMELLPPAPPVSEVVSPLLVTVQDQIALIQRCLSSSPRVAFSHLLRDTRSRVEIIITLLATLEMAKRWEIVLHQEEPFGEIWIEPGPPDERPPQPIPEDSEVAPAETTEAS